MTRRLFTHAIILLLSCAAVAANAQQNNCLPTPVATTAANNIFNEEQEHFLGEAIAARTQKDYAIIEDKALIGYLNAMGDRLLKHLPLKQTKLQFFLVDLADANAFVLPGGRIYVSRKLVALAQNEDELASVISHELGHLAAHEGLIDRDLGRRAGQGLGQAGIGGQGGAQLRQAGGLEGFLPPAGDVGETAKQQDPGHQPPVVDMWRATEGAAPMRKS